MQEVIGNGQPGRLDKVETEVKGQSRLIWIGVGLVLALQALTAVKLFATHLP